MTSQGQEITSKRQLAAILFTDIVGYTKLMGEDEDKAFKVLKRNRDLHISTLEKHNGKMLKELGDGILASFNSVSDAVYCALEIQYLTTLEPDFEIRIGINLGEVVFEGADVHGDGVNIASRLADVAKEGHILISESVNKNIANKKGIQTRFIDKMDLKNVSEPVGIYLVEASSGSEIISSVVDVKTSFWDELQNRNVFRALISYFILSLLLIELGRNIFPVFHFPSWSLQVLIILLILLLPPAMILAWYYERSPQGFVKTSSRQHNPYTTSQRKPLTTNSAIGVLLLIAMIVYGYPKIILTNTSSYTTREIKRFHINFPEEGPVALLGEAIWQWSYSSISLSPDGDVLAYIGWRDGRSQLHLRYLDNMEVVSVAGSEGAYGPFFSPDGNWVAFSTSTMLKKVRIPDGSPVDIAPVSLQSGAVWTENDHIIFSNDLGGDIFRISSRGGTPELIGQRDTYMEYDAVGGYTTSIDITPDQQYILFSDLTGDIFSMNIKTGGSSLIYPQGGGSPRYLPTGHLMFSRNNSLFAVPFDFNKMSPTGQESQVLNGVRTERSGAQITYARDGTAIHIPGYYYQYASFTWIDKNGNEKQIDLDPDNYGSFDISPDGNLLAIGMLPARDNIRIFDFRTSQVKRIRVPGVNRLYSPVWGPDSKSILFGGNSEGEWKMFIKKINEVGDAVELKGDKADTLLGDQWPYSWSKLGSYFDTNGHILQISEDQTSMKSVGRIEGGNHMELSPNEDFWVYGSHESGNPEVYVQPFPQTGEKWQLSIDGGTDPIWTRDGTGIYYHNDIRIYYVKVNTSPGKFEFETPRVFYSGPFINAVSRSLGIGDDNEKLLILQQVQGSQLATEAVVTLNWFDEVKRLAPADK